jgi:uncharacterized membrane protein (UPF0127 family)
MAWIEVRNLSRPLPEPLRARRCVSFFCRLRGLTFRRRLPSKEGLLLVQGRESRLDAAIHMLFVWLDLAIIWLDARKQVVDVQLARSWRPFYMPDQPARYILEVEPAWLPHFEVGDQIEFEEVELD